MRFTRPEGGLVEISAGALKRLTAHRQLSADATEAGGILLGRLVLSSDDIIVDEAVGPAAEDRRTLFSFFRSKRPAQQAVDAAWQLTDGTRIYLGEWHSHPEEDPSPSCVDERDWKHIARNATFQQDSLFFVIVGRRRIRAWEVTKGALRVSQLAAIQREQHDSDTCSLRDG